MPQPGNSTTFQPSTKYSLFGPSYENLSKNEGEEVEEIYEVLDRDDEKSSTKGVAHSGGQSLNYNKLEFVKQL